MDKLFLLLGCDFRNIKRMSDYFFNKCSRVNNHFFESMVNLCWIVWDQIPQIREICARFD